MEVPCSGRKPRSGKKLRSNSCSSSRITKKFDRISKSKDLRYASSREELNSSSSIATKSHCTPIRLGPKFELNDFNSQEACNDDYYLELATQALNFHNQNPSWNFQLLKLVGVARVLLKQGTLFHMNFMARNTHVAAAPDEMFFTEINSNTSGVSVRLCVSLGPINPFSFSGEKLNGCFYCCGHDNVWHPKGGGFTRGGDLWYKTVQDICDTNQNNAIPEYEIQLAGLKQLSLDPKKDRISQQEDVDSARLYASEALKYFNQKGRWGKYELVNPGIVTRVILLPTCLLFHVNFEAKETVTAPKEMFFAELTDAGGVLSCKGCTKLTTGGLSQGGEIRDVTDGCYYCHDFNNVYHPITGYFVRGGDEFYKPASELE